MSPRLITDDLAHDYKFAAGGLYNLNADIAHPEVAHAFWEAVLATPDA